MKYYSWMHIYVVNTFLGKNSYKIQDNIEKRRGMGLGTDT